jgi:hypothetical protein
MSQQCTAEDLTTVICGGSLKKVGPALIDVAAGMNPKPAPVPGLPRTVLYVLART